jgi:serine/threonine-protein kinase
MSFVRANSQPATEPSIPDAAPTHPLGPLGTTPAIGTVIADRYILERVLGSGGMGKVYLARHQLIDKPVAVKVLHPELARDSDHVERFMREARAASSVGSPHIVDVLDAGRLPDGTTYLTMEYLSGETLADFLDRAAPLDTTTICTIGLQLCEGLAAAHNAGIVHRDLKPENVVLTTRGREARLFCKIVDFGIAKMHAQGPEAAMALTAVGAIFGTPHYMAPEQAAGCEVDQRADLYALGVLLFQMASGSLPFDDDDTACVLAQQIAARPVPLASLPEPRADAAEHDAIVLRCLAKNPDHRYQSAEELAGALVALHARATARHDALAWPTSRSDTMGPLCQSVRERAISAAGRTRPARRITRAWKLVGAVLVASCAIALARAPRPRPVDPASFGGLAPAVAAVEDAALAASMMERVDLRSPTQGATVRVDGAEIPLPASIAVLPGRPRAIEVVASGFEPERLSVDGSQPVVEIALVSTTATARRRRPETVAAAPALDSPALGKPRDVVDPWAR